jgi:hypothetical protein
MTIENLTLTQIMALASAVSQVAPPPKPTAAPAAATIESTPPKAGITSGLIGKTCVIRTYSAGVHIGRVVEVDGVNVLLADAVRLWSWKGAFTLNEVSSHGVATGSRISKPVPMILLTQAVEIIPASEVALATLKPTE